MYHELFRHASFWAFLSSVDQDLAKETRDAGCPCGGRLHGANFPRQPRGVREKLPESSSFRLSFCCERDGCRKRRTPPSVRFLGRKVYLAAVVVLVAAMRQGPSPRRLHKLNELFRADERTIARWRKFWCEHFPQTQFWKVARGRFSSPLALADLTDFIGDDLRQIDQELIKLADYVGPARPVTRDDVRRMVPATRAANIFEMMDALGMGDATMAGRLLLHALDVDGEPPLRLLGMIARQYRLLIQAKALQADGLKPPEIAKELGVQEWTAPKLLTQAGRHTFARLERNLEQILAADEAIKTGRLGDREAMDVLFAGLMS